jgi:hypothetical protein
VILACAVADAHAHIEFPSVADRALGIRAGADLLIPNERWSVEAGDVELFGIAGLRVDGVRTRRRMGALQAGVSVAQLSAPVGSEARAELEVGYRPSARWLCRARAGVETVALTGIASEAAILAGFHARAQTGRITTIADVDVVTRAEVRDVEVDLAVVARVRMASIVATARFDGRAVASTGVAVVSRLASALSLIAGYDDGTESIRGAAVVSLASWQLGVGIFQHAVLGVSQGVTLSWSR